MAWIWALPLAWLALKELACLTCRSGVISFAGVDLRSALLIVFGQFLNSGLKSGRATR